MLFNHIPAEQDGNYSKSKGQYRQQLLSVDGDPQKVVPCLLDPIEQLAGNQGHAEAKDAADAVFQNHGLGKVSGVNVAVGDIEGIHIESRVGGAVQKGVDYHQKPGGGGQEDIDKKGCRQQIQSHPEAFGKGGSVGISSKGPGDGDPQTLSQNADKLDHQHRQTKVVDVVHAHKTYRGELCALPEDRQQNYIPELPVPQGVFHHLCHGDPFVLLLLGFVLFDQQQTQEIAQVQHQDGPGNEQQSPVQLAHKFKPIQKPTHEGGKHNTA